MNRLFSRFLASRSALLGGSVLALIVAAAVFAPFLTQHDPMAMVGQPFLRPGADASFILGTDMLGRDIFSGLLYGARISLQVGLAAALVSLTIGIAVGLAGGYFGGWTDQVSSRLTEAFQTVPNLVFVIVTVAILQPSVSSIILGIGITSWPKIARLTRTEAMQVRNAEFVHAARTTGMGNARILWSEILPNSLAPVISVVAIVVATAILTEAALAFLGLGDPNQVSWGSMIGAGREVLRTASYMTVIPGLAISVTVLALIYLGNGINDVLNPRIRL